HIPVHHTNEISQTEAAYGTRLANFWMHGYFLLTQEAKMSKSAGEFLRLQTLIDRGYDPLAYRYLCLTAHYRSQLNFSWEALDAAQTALNRLRLTVHALGAEVGAPDAHAVERFMARLNDDLNFPQALALAHEVAKSALPAPVKRATLLVFDQALGLGLGQWQPKAVDIPDNVRALAEARWAARSAKNWSEADRLRAEIEALGWKMNDAKEGYTLERA
ncbi:MAG: class I tRNA ligase family protein, partial [Casimicrobiaceae bacterium]|nr:class I tRNA ligase family protein [Casimicrobiaceae bacterium]